MILVDSCDWDAGMPIDAPPIAKTLIERLKKAPDIMSSRQFQETGLAACNCRLRLFERVTATGPCDC